MVNTLVHRANGEYTSFSIGADDNALRMQESPDVDGHRQDLMVEPHSSKYSMHPGSTEKCKDLK